MLLSWSYSYPNPLEGTDIVGGQPHGDKAYPFNGMTSSGRDWRKGDGAWDKMCVEKAVPLRWSFIRGTTVLYCCAALEQQVSEVDQRLKTKQDELRVLNSYKVSPDECCMHV